MSNYGLVTSTNIGFGLCGKIQGFLLEPGPMLSHRVRNGILKLVNETSESLLPMGPIANLVVMLTDCCLTADFMDVVRVKLLLERDNKSLMHYLFGDAGTPYKDTTQQVSCPEPIINISEQCGTSLLYDKDNDLFIGFRAKYMAVHINGGEFYRASALTINDALSINTPVFSNLIVKVPNPCAVCCIKCNNMNDISVFLSKEGSACQEVDIPEYLGTLQQMKSSITILRKQNSSQLINLMKETLRLRFGEK